MTPDQARAAAVQTLRDKYSAVVQEMANAFDPEIYKEQILEELKQNKYRVMLTVLGLKREGRSYEVADQSVIDQLITTEIEDEIKAQLQKIMTDELRKTLKENIAKAIERHVMGAVSDLHIGRQIRDEADRQIKKEVQRQMEEFKA